MSREPSVSVAGDSDASVPMEPEGVTMASSISAAVRVPVIWYVSFPHGEPSVRCPVPVAGDGDASVPMEPYQWPAAYQQPSVWIVRYLRLISSRPCGVDP